MTKSNLIKFGKNIEANLIENMGPVTNTYELGVGELCEGISQT